MKIQLKLPYVLLSIGLGVGLTSLLNRPSANALQVKVDRWLAIRQTSGSAWYQTKQQAVLPAKTGMRLQAVGDRIKTGDRSTMVLEVDTGVGFVHVAEKTNLIIQKMQRTSSGGQITQLQVASGQVRLQVRPFTNPSSRLEIQTPGGISGVRGTEFGISVQPNGKTGVATLKGGVATAAQGKSVLVKGGFQSLVIPGEAPSPATPLKDDPRLDIRQLSSLGNQRVRIVGQVDSVNLLAIANLPQGTDRQGNFDITIPLPGQNQRITALVTTPLGKQQIYELSLP
ncbi:FecR domain-containing protein [Leptolyngbyaceae cyanobacterium UHCC 1019]